MYEKLANVKENYLQLTNQQPENGFSEELIGLIWKQFGLIHKIIQDLTDVSDGVIDVVQALAPNILNLEQGLNQ